MHIETVSSICCNLYFFPAGQRIFVFTPVMIDFAPLITRVPVDAKHECGILWVRQLEGEDTRVSAEVGQRGMDQGGMSWVRMERRDAFVSFGCIVRKNT